MDYSQLTDDDLLQEAKRLLEEVANRAEQRAPETANPTLNPYYFHDVGRPKEITGLSLVYHSCHLESAGSLDKAIEALRLYIFALEVVRNDIESSLCCDFDGFLPPKEDVNLEYWFKYLMGMLSESSERSMIPPRSSLVEFDSNWIRYICFSDKSFGQRYVEPHAQGQVKKAKDAARRREQVSLVNSVIFYLNKIEGLPITDDGEIFKRAGEILFAKPKTVRNHYYEYQSKTKREVAKRLFDFLLESGRYRHQPGKIEEFSRKARDLFPKKY